MAQTQCTICNKLLDSRGLGSHVKCVHNLDYRTEYCNKPQFTKVCKCGCGTPVNRDWVLGHWILNNNPMKNEVSKYEVGKSWRGKKQPTYLIEKRIKTTKLNTNNYEHLKTDEFRLNASISRLGHVHSEETKTKMRGPRPTMVGENNPSKRPEVRQKLRIARTKQILNSNSTVNFNIKACDIFDKLNIEFGWNGQHAKNKGEKIVLGYWVDYYEPKLNLVIEWDEPFHYIDGKLRPKDVKRQTIITNKLKCNFIRIKQDVFEYDTLINQLRNIL